MYVVHQVEWISGGKVVKYVYLVTETVSDELNQQLRVVIIIILPSI